ncbi:MAG: hypothetical protein WCG47_19765, partial [Dermatophilaceae bacterium]
MLLGLLTLAKLLDWGFLGGLGRPFNPVTDWSYLGSAAGLLNDSVGWPVAIVSLASAGMLGVAVLVLMPLSLLRLTRFVGRHGATSTRAVTALGVVWALCAVFGLQLVPGDPIASTSAAGFVDGKVSQVGDGIQNERVFASALADDPIGNTAANKLLTGCGARTSLWLSLRATGASRSKIRPCRRI